MNDAIMQIRPLKKPDEEDVIALWQRCDLTRPWNDPAKDIARKLEVKKGEWFFVGEIGGKIVATVMIGYDGHRGWINYLAVDPDHRKSGCGRAMMVEAERVLREAGCPKINLQVRIGNDEALEFYKRIGFVQDQCLSMGKRLVDDSQSGKDS